MKLKLPQIKKPNLRFKPDLLAKAKRLEGRLSGTAKKKLRIEPINSKDKVLAAVGYLFLAGLIIRLFKKKPSVYLDYHERQSIVLFVIFSFVLLVPSYGFTILGPIFLLLMVVNLIVSALGGTLRLMPR